MGKNETVNTAELSAGQKKRLDRKKEIAAAKRKKKIEKIVAIVVCVALVLGAGYGIGYSIYKNVSITKPISDYGKGLTADGMIEGVVVKDIVKTIDFNSITVKYSDIQLTDAKLEEKINTVLSNNKYYSEDTSLTAAAGNSVNVNYSCTLDGEDVPNVGNASVKDGLNFTISSTIGATATPTPTATPTATPTPTSKPTTYQALFQEGVVGMHPGETKEITVEIPADFTVNSSASIIAGKTVVFKVTLNKIQVTPELTDSFVTEKLKEETGCTSAEEYKAYVRTTTERESLESKISDMIESTDNTSVSEYPSKYLKIKKGQVMNSYQSNYAQMNALYAQYGMATYSSIYDYYKTTWKEFEKNILSTAQRIVAIDCAYQYIYEELGLSITDEEYEKYITDNTDYKTAAEYDAKNSRAYALKSLMTEKVVKALADKATIEK